MKTPHHSTTKTSNRREFIGASLAAAAALGVPSAPAAEKTAAAISSGGRSYLYHGRPDGYAEFKVIEPGRRIDRIESFHNDLFTLVRVTTEDGREGFGQIASHDNAASVEVLHGRVAPLVLEQDAADIDAIVDRCIDGNHKFPWSFVCRALGGVETAMWDLYGQIRRQPVAELLGGAMRPLPAYGSSMSRSISPEAEAARLVKLRDAHGFEAYKIRVGQQCGHDLDAAPGRTEKIVPVVRKALATRFSSRPTPTAVSPRRAQLRLAAS